MNTGARSVWLDTDYPAVRRIMGADRDRLDDDDIEQMLGGLFPESDPVDVEDFMRSVQQFGKQAAPLAQKALPGMIQGAQMGASMGPMGMVAGALGGGALSLAAGGPPGANPVSPLSPPMAQPVAPAPAPAFRAAPGPSSPTGAEPMATNAAAAQLLALLSRPETMQALLALLMANAGRPAVLVGDQPIPAAAFANAISELAADAAASFEGPARDRLSDYLQDENGNPRIDVSNPAERAALLLVEIGRVAEEEAFDEDEEDDAYEPDSLEEGVDPLAGYELAREGRDPYDY